MNLKRAVTEREDDFSIAITATTHRKISEIAEDRGDFLAAVLYDIVNEYYERWATIRDHRAFLKLGEWGGSDD